MEKDDLMLNEGAAGAAQYEEAYNNNNRNTGYNAGTIQPRKLQTGGLKQDQFYGNSGGGGHQDNHEDGGIGLNGP